MPAYVGLDVCQTKVDVCVLLADGTEPVARWTVPNTAPGAADLSARLADLAGAHGVDTWHIGLEATGWYSWHVAQALATATVLAPSQPTVYLLNPARVAAFRQNYGPLPKTDRVDAFLIADHVRFGRTLPSPFRVDPVYAPLQRLTRFRLHLVQTLTREKTYFLSHLFLVFSGFEQADPFSNPFGATSCAVLEDLTPEEIAAQSVEELADFLQERGRGQFADPTALARTLQQAATDSYHLDAVVAHPLRQVLAMMLVTIRTLQAQLKDLDAAIARELAAIPHTLSSVPGLGPVWTAGLLAEIGNIQRFKNDGALAQYAGLTWTSYQSGAFQAEDTSVTKAGNSYLRYYLVEAANSVRVHCPEYRAYYHKKVGEVTKHAHKRALVLTARKLVRLLDALLRAQQLYQPPTAPSGQKEERGTRRRPQPAPAVALAAG